MKNNFRILLGISFAFCLLSPATHAGEVVKKKKNVSMSDLLAASKPSDWRTPDPEHVLYLDLSSGRVVIELAPDFAPNHVANVQALSREHYWDGLAIVRVQDDYVVQWADPNEENPGLRRKIKNAHATLPAEFESPIRDSVPFTRLWERDTYALQVGFSNGFPVARDAKTGENWLIHCYGAVGAGRDTPINSGGGTELYAVIGHAPRQLDRNVTLLGRVIYGMEFLSSLPRGHGDLGFYKSSESTVPIRSVRLASDVPASERTELQVLRTDTPLFTKIVASRKNRREEWFHLPAGHIDVCNVPVPVLLKKDLPH